MRVVHFEPTLESWREASRPLLDARIPPDAVEWDDGSVQQFRIPATPPEAVGNQSTTRYRVPVRFHELAQKIQAHRSSARWPLLYRLLFRLTFENRELLRFELDDDVREAIAMEKQISRDVHKMHAFVRFRLVEDENEQRYVAWYRPDHRVIRLVASFFVERFPTMRWSIITPDECAHWDQTTLTFTPGLPRESAPADDELESLWKTYYGSIFNPARMKLGAMRSEMPTRFWKELPETRIIPALLQEAPVRVERMLHLQRTAPSARPFIPPARDLDSLRDAARACEGCELHAPATQSVFGEGAATARIVLVGEQPGTEEDRSGRPFVGPAGEVLDEALSLAGLRREELYVTNAVKHFKFEERGKQRIHRTPKTIEAVACRPWVEAELESIAPDVLVCLGATAAKSLLGANFQLLKQRGNWMKSRWAGDAIATIHPSAVLRGENAEVRKMYFDYLVGDLRLVAERHEQATAVARPAG